MLLFGGFGLGVSLLDALDMSFNFKFLGGLTENVACNLVLGLLLVFRTNTAYDRFWEGRKAWGTLVVTTRNLAREIQLGVKAETAEAEAAKQKALQLLSAFAIATKLHLRHQAIANELNSLGAAQVVADLKQSKNPPLDLVLHIGSYIQQQHGQGCIDSNQRWAMNNLLNELIAGLTSCERILSTPIPPAYATYLKSLLLLYCLLLPFGLVDQLQIWTGFAVALISFILLGVEEIGNEIEDPFGTDPNDLPIDAICSNIINSVENTMSFSTETTEVECPLSI
jgi:putative membrane protein